MEAEDGGMEIERVDGVYQGATIQDATGVNGRANDRHTENGRRRGWTKEVDRALKSVEYISATASPEARMTSIHVRSNIQ